LFTNLFTKRRTKFHRNRSNFTGDNTKTFWSDFFRDTLYFMKLITAGRHDPDGIEKVTGSKVKVNERWP